MLSPMKPPADASDRVRKTDWRRLLALVAPHRATLVAGFVSLVIGTGMTLVYPRLVGLLLDTVIAGKDLSGLNRVILLLLVVFAVQSAFNFARTYLFTKVGERVVTDLRQRLYQALSVQEIAFFDAQRTGDLISRLASDTAVLQNTVTANLSVLMRFGLQAIGGVAILVYTSPRLTAVMMAVVPVVVLAAVLYGRRVRMLSRKVQDALAVSSEIAEETLSNIRTVRSFVRENWEQARYRDATEEAYARALERTRTTALFGAVVMYASSAAVALVLWYGGRMVVEGRLTAGLLTSFVLYTLMVAIALGTLTSLQAEFMKALGASERVFDLIDRRPAVTQPGDARVPKQARGSVRFDRVTFAYPTRPEEEVLREISFTLRPGDVVALVGPSGAGKSTIASLIPRFYDPQAGAILFDEHDLRTLDLTWLRHQVGTVAQEPVLFAGSIEENIAYGKLDATREEIEAAARAANAHQFVTEFPDGYATRVGERGVRLSGGQKQRIAIARALLKDPRVLILDEATSALDSESEYLVQEALERLMRGRTTLIIAHRLSTVRAADRVLVLDRGRIVQEGTHEALLARPGLYRRLVERQFEAENGDSRAGKEA